MGRFTGGLIAGATLGAVGFALAVTDKRTRKRMMKDGRRAMHKASDFIDDIR